MTNQPDDTDIECEACAAQRRHTKVDWLNHPFKGHGFTPETGWTDERLALAAKRGTE